ncbi:MAG: hypothetical protein JXE07_09135 [Candidatus Aminicenantes bacterium]|nr:hypothetical protein [Candidatus Aminicenantes bacterium]
MSTRKALALAGFILVLGSGLVMAQEEKPQGATNMVQSRVRAEAKTQPQVQTRLRFMDQNGDGINDFWRDHDNDGVPNCQDRDWTRPGDGTGYQNQFARKGPQNQMTNRRGFLGNQEWSNSSFRHGFKGMGGGVCDGTGPKGSGQRRGRG